MFSVPAVWPAQEMFVKIFHMLCSGHGTKFDPNTNLVRSQKGSMMNDGTGSGDNRMCPSNTFQNI